MEFVGLCRAARCGRGTRGKEIFLGVLVLANCASLIFILGCLWAFVLRNYRFLPIFLNIFFASFF